MGGGDAIPPLPLQVEAGCKDVPPDGQDAGATDVPAGQKEQLPLPLHFPVVPQVVEPVAAQSLPWVSPGLTRPQVPVGSPVLALRQELHFVPQVLLQHTFSAQERPARQPFAGQA